MRCTQFLARHLGKERGKALEAQQEAKRQAQVAERREKHAKAAEEEAERQARVAETREQRAKAAEQKRTESLFDWLSGTFRVS